MVNELSSVLGNVIAQAAKLPTNTGAVEAIDSRMKNASMEILLILDISSSMHGEPIQILTNAVRDIIPDLPTAPKIIEFSSFARFIPTIDHIGEVGGGTSLDKALQLAQTIKPRHTVILTDGEPTDGYPDPETACLNEAAKLTGSIDVIFCGSDTDTEAIEFCRKLAKIGIGRATVVDLHKKNARPALSMQMRTTLRLPAPAGS